MEETKFCKHCGEKIAADAVICPKCGRQVEEVKSRKTKSVVINNNNSASISSSPNTYRNERRCNKWVALLLCLFFGWFGAHKFYEGNSGMGIIYLLTGGLFLIGWFVDLFVILSKPEEYTVYY